MRSHKSRRGTPCTGFLGGCAVLALFGFLAYSTTAHGAAVIVNEYNCVDSNRYLNGNDYEDGIDPDFKEDSYFRTIPDMPNGRIEGNGGNWIELVVVQDHFDLRGWSLKWAETGANATDLTDPWYGDPTVEQGIISFSNTAPIWSDLRAGTIITLSEKDSIGVDTDWDGNNRNFTDEPLPTAADVTIPLHTDTGYNPAGGDWWIHVSSRQEQADGTLLMSTVTNVDGDNPGDFSVGPDDWQVSIFDADNVFKYGPIGEDMADWAGGGVSSREAGRLELPPQDPDPHDPWPDPPWDLADWELVSNAGYDDATSTSFGQPNVWGTPEEIQDLSALRGLIPEPGTIVMLLSAAVSLILFWRRIRNE